MMSANAGTAESRPTQVDPGAKMQVFKEEVSYSCVGALYKCVMSTKSWEPISQGYVHFDIIHTPTNVEGPFSIRSKTVLDGATEAFLFRIVAETRARLTKATFLQWHLKGSSENYGIQLMNEEQATTLQAVITKAIDMAKKAVVIAPVASHSQPVELDREKEHRLLHLNRTGQTADAFQLLESATDQGGEKKQLMLRVHLPDDQSTMLRMDSSAPLEALLIQICEKRNLDTSTHALADKAGKMFDASQIASTSVADMGENEVVLVDLSKMIGVGGKADEMKMLAAHAHNAKQIDVGSEEVYIQVHLPDGSKTVTKLPKNTSMGEMLFHIADKRGLDVGGILMATSASGKKLLSVKGTIEQNNIKEVYLVSKKVAGSKKKGWTSSKKGAKDTLRKRGLEISAPKLNDTSNPRVRADIVDGSQSQSENEKHRVTSLLAEGVSLQDPRLPEDWRQLFAVGGIDDAVMHSSMSQRQRFLDIITENGGPGEMLRMGHNGIHACFEKAGNFNLQKTVDQSFVPPPVGAATQAQTRNSGQTPVEKPMRPPPPADDIVAKPRRLAPKPARAAPAPPPTPKEANEMSDDSDPFGEAVDSDPFASDEPGDEPEDEYIEVDAPAPAPRDVPVPVPVARARPNPQPRAKPPRNSVAAVADAPVAKPSPTVRRRVMPPQQQEAQTAPHWSSMELPVRAMIEPSQMGDAGMGLRSPGSPTMHRPVTPLQAELAQRLKTPSGDSRRGSATSRMFDLYNVAADDEGTAAELAKVETEAAPAPAKGEQEMKVASTEAPVDSPPSSAPPVGSPPTGPPPAGPPPTGPPPTGPPQQEDDSKLQQMDSLPAPTFAPPPCGPPKDADSSEDSSEDSSKLKQMDSLPAPSFAPPPPPASERRVFRNPSKEKSPPKKTVSVPVSVSELEPAVATVPSPPKVIAAASRPSPKPTTYVLTSHAEGDQAGEAEEEDFFSMGAPPPPAFALSPVPEPAPPPPVADVADIGDGFDMDIPAPVMPPPMDMPSPMISPIRETSVPPPPSSFASSEQPTPPAPDSFDFDLPPPPAPECKLAAVNISFDFGDLPPPSELPVAPIETSFDFDSLPLPPPDLDDNMATIAEAKVPASGPPPPPPMMPTALVGTVEGSKLAVQRSSLLEQISGGTARLRTADGRPVSKRDAIAGPPDHRSSLLACLGSLGKGRSSLRQTPSKEGGMRSRSASLSEQGSVQFALSRALDNRRSALEKNRESILSNDADDDWD